MVKNQTTMMKKEEGDEGGEAVVEGLAVRVVRVVHPMTLMTMMMTTIMADIEIEVVGILVVVKIIITTETMAMLRLEVHPPGL